MSFLLTALSPIGGENGGFAFISCQQVQHSFSDATTLTYHLLTLKHLPYALCPDLPTINKHIYGSVGFKKAHKELRDYEADGRQG
ncbi:hypothetical protein GJ744_007371 [Endocarpon pusillum]|uniref:Uncharacterized protein n=1 Tax=Endocarpon pusillum TaxID=364733 RepID=A0A8H7E647_9EURO|nr:hypothetical protein GJ744_007371 [Endocarpon pusillum]